MTAATGRDVTRAPATGEAPAAPRILDVIALSPAQRELHAASGMNPGADPYVVLATARIEGLGPDGPTLLRDAFTHILERHPHLRGGVVADGPPRPVLVVPDRADGWWAERDLSGRAPDDARTGLDALVRAERLRPFDLARGPLARVTAVLLPGGGIEMVLVAHHLVVDGWSVPVIVGELVALLSGAGDTLPPAPRLRDHALWLAAKDAEAAAAWWRRTFADVEPTPPIAPPAPAGVGLPTSGTARASAEASAAILAGARALSVTPGVLFQMAWARILSSATGRDRVVFGLTDSGRPSDLPAADRIVGALVTTAPVVVDIDDRPIRDVAASVRTRLGEHLEHSHPSASGVVEIVGPAARFDTLLIVQNTPRGGLDAARSGGVPLPGGARLLPGRIESLTHQALTIVPTEIDGALEVTAEVREDLGNRFHPETLARRVLAVAERLARSPESAFSEVDTLIPGERAVIVPEHPAPAPTPADPDAVALLSRAADAQPEHPAVEDADGAWTFAESMRWIRATAATLRAEGVTDGEHVAVALPRDRRVLLAPFAVALAGGVCVHVAPDTPPGRLATITRLSGARLVLGDPAVHAAPGVRVVDPPMDVDDTADTGESSAGTASRSADRPFYVIFTSGTTGEPKGVVVPHRALTTFWGFHEREIHRPAADRLGRPPRVGHAWSTGFDASWQPLVAILGGNTVVISDDATRTDPEALVAFLRDRRVDIVETSPSMLPRLEAAGLLDGTGPALTVLGIGGEPVGEDTWRRLRSLDGTRVVNFFGPTETTVDAVTADLAEHPHPVIGRPVDGLNAEIVDHRGRPVPEGAEGELLLGGVQVADGYLGRPDLTAERFDVGPAGRRYRTGDLVRRLPGDVLEHRGRIDDQVKINGFRVEPSEVAAALRDLAGVAAAAVVPWEVGGRTRLGALVVVREDAPGLSPDALRGELSVAVPRHMVPSRIVVTGSIPLTRNDKVDADAARALLDTDRAGALAGGTVAPETDTEHALVAALAEHCGAPGIGVTDELLDIGLDSISVMALISGLRGAGYDVGPRDVLDAPDLRALADRIDERAREAAAGGGTATSDGSAPRGGQGADPHTGRLLPLTALAAEVVGLGDHRGLVQAQVLRVPASTGDTAVAAALGSVVRAHPALRSVPEESGGRLGLRVLPPSAVPVPVVREGVDAAVAAARADIAPDRGVMLAARYVAGAASSAGTASAGTASEGTASEGTAPADEGDLLVLVIHHLAVDAVSWSVIVGDLASAAAGTPPPTEPVYELAAAADPAGYPPTAWPGIRPTDPRRDRRSAIRELRIHLDPAETAAVLDRAAADPAGLHGLLLRLAAALAAPPGVPADAGAVVTVEEHGRGALTDPSGRAEDRAVGWFTRERHLLVRPGGTVPAATRGAVRLNHLGRLDRTAAANGGPWTPVLDPDLVARISAGTDGALPLRYTLDVQTAVIPTPDGPVLAVSLEANGHVIDESHMQALMSLTRGFLTAGDEDHAPA